MLRSKLSFTTAALTFAFCLGASSVLAQPAGGTRYDVTNYRIEAQLNPDEHTLRAGADITFVPQEATRSIVFELNGSLKVEGVEKDGKVLTMDEPAVLAEAQQVANAAWSRQFRARMDLKIPDGFLPAALP